MSEFGSTIYEGPPAAFRYVPTISLDVLHVELLSSLVSIVYLMGSWSVNVSTEEIII